jgi:Spherulation-specific family 4
VTAEPARNGLATGQRLLIPAYFYPSGSQWQEMCDALDDRGIEAVIVMNPASGPGTVADSTYAAVLDYCLSKRQQVIGYIDTDYRERNLALVKAEVEQFYALYPGIAGVFLDQVSNEPRRAVKTYYRKLYRHIKDTRPDALVVGNPGVPALTPWQVRGGGIADILCVFEMPAAEYADWSPPNWVASRDAATFAQLVYGTGDANDTASVCAATVEKNAGWIYVTQGLMPNPWAAPPEPAMYDHAGLERRAPVAT